MFRLAKYGFHTIRTNASNRGCSTFMARINGYAVNFGDIIKWRQDEAARSIVVQVNSENSYPELHRYCSQFGSIQSAHHYKIEEDNRNYILIEFSNNESVAEALNFSVQNEEHPGIPAQSPFLWFRAGAKSNKLKILNSDEDISELNIVNGNEVLPDKNISNLVQWAKNIDDQMHTLYKWTSLNDLGIRLRFIAASQIEKCIQGMFPNARAYPFGSSINGFGRLGCDLDLILRFDKDVIENSIDRRLVFHSKENMSNERSQMQRVMETVGDIMQLFLPGVCHVRRILQARVPIIKYHHEHLNLEVDLSVSNLTGLYMSELLFLLGEIDTRVRPLVFTIRKWAQTVGLTNQSPGRWISNFSLTCLVIFFLQQLKTPILPPIEYLVNEARPGDVRITEDKINCTFLRDLNALDYDSENEDSLATLFLQFFEFYSQFDFHNRAISLNKGESILKPDHSPIYIVNPLETNLNVSKNISYEECERLRIEVRNAAWILESQKGDPSQDIPWGILNVFRTTEQKVIRPQMFYKPRMVEVSDLFQDSEDIESSNRIGDIKIKNAMVQNQINAIQRKGRTDLKKMKLVNIEATIHKDR